MPKVCLTCMRVRAHTHTHTHTHMCTRTIIVGLLQWNAFIVKSCKEIKNLLNVKEQVTDYISTTFFYDVAGHLECFTVWAVGWKFMVRKWHWYEPDQPMKAWDLKQLAGCKDSPHLCWISHRSQRTEVKAYYCKQFYSHFSVGSYWPNIIPMWEPSMGTSHRLPKPVSKQQLNKQNYLCNQQSQ
jgi:hypothetical protein